MDYTDIIRLELLGLPAIQSIDDFSTITRLSKHTIYQLSVCTLFHYREYTIPKKSGKLREICQPDRKLKGLQVWVLRNILDKLQVSPSCKGFEKGSSIVNNAEAHRTANTILNVDLKDFFTSINGNCVFKLFKTIGYNNLIACTLTNICTYKGYLPQGSPCSPKLANLIAWRFDKRIQGYIGKRGLAYTRYADDITISGLNPLKVVNTLPMIKQIILDEKFCINNKKTRIAGSARCKKITGLIISNDSFGIGKRKYKELRAKIHHLVLPNEQSNPTLLSHVIGWLSFLKSVDAKRFEKTKLYILRLRKVYPKTLINDIKI